LRKQSIRDLYQFNCSLTTTRPKVPLIFLMYYRSYFNRLEFTMGELANNCAKSNVLTLIHSMKQKIDNLPPNELNFYLVLLLETIKEELDKEKLNLVMIKNLMSKTDLLIDALKNCYNDKENDELRLSLAKALKDLVDTSALYTFPKKVKLALLNICGLVIAAIASLTGGLITSIAAMAAKNPTVPWFRRGELGFFSGSSVGLIAGYRAPRIALRSKIDIKIQHCLDHIQRVVGELKERKTQEDYYKQTKKQLFEKYFTGTDEEKEQQFTHFLQTEQAFQVCTTTAGHITKDLKGYLGHHALIRFKISNIAGHIEYGYNEVPAFVDQCEPERQVTGEKLFEMLMLHNQLRETHLTTLRAAISFYQAGNNDCRTYIDKILIGTHQIPSKVGRFGKLDKPIAQSLVGPLMEYVSDLPAAALHSLIDNSDGPQFPVIDNIYEKGAKYSY
jgi:hypothetical protein